MRRIEAPTQEVDQEIDPEIIAAHRQQDGTYVFEDPKSYGFEKVEDNSDIEDDGEYEEDLILDFDPEETEFNHVRSHILRNEIDSSLRKVDLKNAVKLDCFNVAIMPRKIINAIEQVEKIKKPSFFDAIPILGGHGQEIAYIGLGMTSPYDFIVEPLVDNPNYDPEITIYAGDEIELPDSFGHGMEDEYTYTYLERVQEVVGGRIKQEPHVFQRLDILDPSFGNFPHEYLFVRLGSKLEYAPQVAQF
jgi:hypothetical protein